VADGGDYRLSRANNGQRHEYYGRECRVHMRVSMKERQCIERLREE
jgi:hypothetical protein